MARPRKIASQGMADVALGASYSEDEVEFIRAMDTYQRKTGLRFPSFTDVLAVAKSLGYRKVEGPTDTPRREETM